MNLKLNEMIKSWTPQWRKANQYVGIVGEWKHKIDRLSMGGKSIHEIEKICKKIEAEKLELEAALSEAEGTLEQEEN